MSRSPRFWICSTAALITPEALKQYMSSPLAKVNANLSAAVRSLIRMGNDRDSAAAVGQTHIHTRTNLPYDGIKSLLTLMMLRRRKAIDDDRLPQRHAGRAQRDHTVSNVGENDADGGGSASVQVGRSAPVVSGGVMCAKVLRTCRRKRSMGPCQHSTVLPGHEIHRCGPTRSNVVVAL